jgi:hypothetical protein
MCINFAQQNVMKNFLMPKELSRWLDQTLSIHEPIPQKRFVDAKTLVLSENYVQRLKTPNNTIIGLVNEKVSWEIREENTDGDYY